jgi:hypothetical protein
MRIVTCLQIPTVFLVGERIAFSQLLNVYSVSDVRQIEIHTAEPLVPHPSPFEVKLSLLSSKIKYHQAMIKL